jgi:hypothetical protein
MLIKNRTVEDMNKRMKNMSQEIRSGKQLQENLPKFFNYMADRYQTYASVRLAMHYYTFYEACLEEENAWSGEAKAVTADISGIMTHCILARCSGEDREKAVYKIDSLRNEIGKRMNILTAYTDIFQIYEYVLNRLEYRFGEELEPMDEEEFAREILRYIFDGEDNLIINEKIREIIGQLPVRITRQKYLDLLEESLQVYLGAEEASLQTYLYMLRTSAMLYHETGMEDYYPELAKRKEQLAALDYKNITREAFDQAADLLREATMMLETEATIYFGLQEIVNEVYAMLLCSAYAGMDLNDNPMEEKDYEAAAAAAMDIIKEINHSFSQAGMTELRVDLLDSFSGLEGVQEALAYDLTLLEDTLYEAEHSHKELVNGMMLEQLLQVLLRAQKLLSNSLFVDLNEVRKEVTVDEEILERETKALLQEMRELFADQDRMISRAVIANTINKMPVFFKDHKEVMEYVRYSLERCSDEYEKTACHDIISQILYRE